MANPFANYGTDQHGVICGFLITPDGPARELDSNQARDWLSLTDVDRGAGFLWLHFNLAHTGSLKWMHAHGNLPDEFFDTLHEDSHSTRIELVESSLLAVINDFHYDFSLEASEIATLWLSVHPRLVISARAKPLRSIDALREAVKHGQIIRSPIELLVRLLHQQESVLVDILRSVTQRVDQGEDRLLLGKLGVTRAELGGLRRLLVRLQRFLAPEPASLFRMLQLPPAWIDDVDRQELRQSTEEFTVVLRDMNALQERIKLLQEELAAHVNEQNNRSLYVLTIVTVLALPINITAGLMGMNVGGIPLAESAHGFWLVAGLILSGTSFAAWLVFKKRNS